MNWPKEWGQQFVCSLYFLCTKMKPKSSGWESPRHAWLTRVGVSEILIGHLRNGAIPAHTPVNRSILKRSFNHDVLLLSYSLEITFFLTALIRTMSTRRYMIWTTTGVFLSKNVMATAIMTNTADQHKGKNRSQSLCAVNGLWSVYKVKFHLALSADMNVVQKIML